MQTKPGGEVVIKEYNKTKSLTDSTRRKMINILTADMTEKHGTSPPRHIREMYAKGIVALFPYLSDPYSKNGYEHFYDPQSGQGYLSWKIKNIQRNSISFQCRQLTTKSISGGPTAERGESSSSEITFTEEQCREAISLMKHTPEEEIVRAKMKETFLYRRNMVQDPCRCTDMLDEFSRFLDVKGLIEQDFVRLFDERTSARFLEKWPTMFKQKVIQQCKTLHASQVLQELINAAEMTLTECDCEDAGWDSDLASVLLLLHLIPPSPQGRKRPGKMSATQAEKHLVVFKKAGTSIQDHLDSIKESTQPYLLALGTNKNRIHGYFIILDRKAIPCKSVSALGAFDELFKTHFVFSVSYNKVLHNMYTFVQTTVFQIDIGKVKESPRVAELRARFLH
ncbi:uncharacterized protein LOC143518340 [Brachyhypopomus gauderio]|uniref:uncharacterized protein LOC143518340 n=1 Tax=Brachyhypopomus gauderio TaxID=698409 RepID=UPI00404271EF